MTIIETPIFTSQLQSLMDDEEYRSLQNELIKQPDAGNIIRGSGGLRKLRWSITGRGKRGGARVIYYWIAHRQIILMLLVYPKSKQENLTSEQLRRRQQIKVSSLRFSFGRMTTLSGKRCYLYLLTPP